MSQRGIEMLSLNRLLAVIAVAGIVATADEAGAHMGSMSYSDVRINDARTKIEYTLRLDTRDLMYPLRLEEGKPVPDELVEKNLQLIYDYVLGDITVETDGRECPIERHSFSFNDTKPRYVALSWTITCDKPFRAMAVDYVLLFDEDKIHTGNLRVTYKHKVVPTPLQKGRGRFVWENLEGETPGIFLPYVLSGIEHILFGFDHLAFLFGLLLIAVVARQAKDEWKNRSLGAAIKYTGVIVTSFTIAHTITLVSAAMGWITLPVRFVESMIAVSIVYVAIENIVYPQTRYRWMLTFGFGLMHGMGFASVLRNMLPPEDVVIPLLAFNVGVELGQLSIVALVIPILYVMTTRILDAYRYWRWFVTIASAAIGAAGIVWLVQRAL